MVLERMIVGSIPRRILGRFRASQATRPPRQGLLFRSYSKSAPCTTVESRYLGARVGERALDSSVRNKTVPSVATHPPESGVICTIPQSAFPLPTSVICHLSSHWLSAIAYWLFAKRWLLAIALPIPSACSKK